MPARLGLTLRLSAVALCLAGNALASEIAVPQVLAGQAGSAVEQLAAMKNLMRDLAPAPAGAAVPGSAQLAANQAQLFQLGTNNHAAISQAGLGNTALLVQMGRGNTATIAQIRGR
jgi:hypothetical protein